MKRRNKIREFKATTKVKKRASETNKNMEIFAQIENTNERHHSEMCVNHKNVQQSSGTMISNRNIESISAYTLHNVQSIQYTGYSLKTPTLSQRTPFDGWNNEHVHHAWWMVNGEYMGKNHMQLMAIWKASTTSYDKWLWWEKDIQHSTNDTHLHGNRWIFYIHSIYSIQQKISKLNIKTATGVCSRYYVEPQQMRK